MQTHLILAAAISSAFLPFSFAAETVQNFDVPGTPYTIGDGSTPPELPPEIRSDGPTGNYLRLVHGSTGGTFDIGFDATSPGPFQGIAAEFDFRMTPRSGKADGLGFMLLNTTHFGNTGAAPLIRFEEANLAGSFGVGFDIFDNSGIDPLEPTSNHLSLHFNGVTLAAFDPGMNLANSQFNHALIQIDPTAGGSLVSVSLTPSGGATLTPISSYFINGLLPYEARVAFGARTGAERADHDLDNINVIYSVPEPSIGALSFVCASLFFRRRHKEEL